MLLDPDFGVHASRPDGPQSLYRAVVARAVLDLFGKVIPGSEGEDAQHSRRAALYFLVRDRGAWAESRRDLCGACGIDPDALRKHVLHILNGGEITGADARNVFGGIDAARRLWEAENNLPPRPKKPKRRDAPPRGVSPSYSVVRSAILPLLSEPHQFKELIFATDGEFGDSIIRKVLANAIRKGEVEHDGENHTYVLAA